MKTLEMRLGHLMVLDGFRITPVKPPPDLVGTRHVTNTDPTLNKYS